MTKKKWCAIQYYQNIDEVKFVNIDGSGTIEEVAQKILDQLI
jgi:adenylate kinase family enzyme